MSLTLIAYFDTLYQLKVQPNAYRMTVVGSLPRCGSQALRYKEWRASKRVIKRKVNQIITWLFGAGMHRNKTSKSHVVKRFNASVAQWIEQ